MVFGTTKKEPTELEKRNRQLARRAAAEGFVLLENNGVLPLKPCKVALYGSGARRTVKGGTGSGAVRERYSVSIEEGLKGAGYEIATTGWLDRFDAFYQETYKKYEDAVEEKVKGIRDFYRILGMAGKFDHPTGIPITDEDIKNSGVDTAVYVLARQAGEGDDRQDIQGDYRLDPVERENLCKAASCYKNLIVVINAGGVIDVSFLDEIKVAALVYYVQGGEEGGNAFADVLSGKVNFSGRLATGWAYDFLDIPSNTTYSYLGKNKYNQEYNEGIYVGYRYFDTFGIQPRYHFGYGLSYTEFAIEKESISIGKDLFFIRANPSAETKTVLTETKHVSTDTETETADIQRGQVTVSVKVSNIGDFSGREVVQLYGTVPFGSGAEYQRLLAFAKTRELEPGEAVTMELRFGLRDLAVYEEKEAAYILRAENISFGWAMLSTRPSLWPC